MDGRFSSKLKTFISVLVLVAAILSTVIASQKVQQTSSLSPVPSSSSDSITQASPLPSVSVSATDSSTVLGTTTREKVIIRRIIDGDTIELSDGRKLRYIGIDTPETVKPNAPVECFGKDASNKNKELAAGKQAELEKDVSEVDRYGRLLRFVYIDGVMINELLVRQGFAYASTYPPDVKYSQLFKEAQKEAQEFGLGLWGACPVHKSDKL
ncbi:MAG: thermonuclease family protein [bacterium]|nr:thermonuclease family protein [bacterium]